MYEDLKISCPLCGSDVRELEGAEGCVGGCSLPPNGGVLLRPELSDPPTNVEMSMLHHWKTVVIFASVRAVHAESVVRGILRMVTILPRQLLIQRLSKNSSVYELGYLGTNEETRLRLRRVGDGINLLARAEAVRELHGDPSVRDVASDLFVNLHPLLEISRGEEEVGQDEGVEEVGAERPGDG